jgi:hypothetical protein
VFRCRPVGFRADALGFRVGRFCVRAFTKKVGLYNLNAATVKVIDDQISRDAGGEGKGRRQEKAKANLNLRQLHTGFAPYLNQERYDSASLGQQGPEQVGGDVGLWRDD